MQESVKRLSRAVKAEERTENSSATPIFFFLLFTIALLSVTSVSALTNDVILSYSYEALPDTEVIDDSGNALNAELYVSGQTGIVNPIVGNVYFNVTNSRSLTTGLDISKIDNGSDHTFPITISTFFRIPSGQVSNSSYTVFSLTDTVNEQFDTAVALSLVYQKTDGISNLNRFWLGFTTTNTQCTFSLMRRISANLQNDEEYHLVAVIRDTLGNMDLYINGTNQSSTLIYNSQTSINNAGVFDNLYIGNSHPSGVILCSVFQSTAINQPNTKHIDQFTLYDKALTQNEITSLYNAGAGINPFGLEIPFQIASIAPVNLSFQSTQAVEFANLFQDETRVEITYSYDETQVFLSPIAPFASTVNNGDFAIEFETNTRVRFYGLNTIVSPVMIGVRACNNVGCSAFTDELLLSVGFDGNQPFQIATIAPIVLSVDSQTVRNFDDYFLNFNDNFVQIQNPQTQEVEFASDGFPLSNDCVDITVTGTAVLFQSKNSSCVINGVYFVVDDGVTPAISNLLSISVVNGTTPVGAVGGVVNAFSGIFPSSEELSFSTRMGYVLLVMLVTLAVGLFIVWNSKGAGTGFAGIGVGAVLFMEFLYFTAISYIPIVWVVIFSLVVVLLGAGYFTSRTTPS